MQSNILLRLFKFTAHSISIGIQTIKIVRNITNSKSKIKRYKNTTEPQQQPDHCSTTSNAQSTKNGSICLVSAVVNIRLQFGQHTNELKKKYIPETPHPIQIDRQAKTIHQDDTGSVEEREKERTDTKFLN